MNNVMCVKWGDYYSPEYVNNLYGMVERNLTEPFRFICLTDNRNGIRSEVETKELTDKTLEGWWSKIEFFKSPLYDIEGSVLTIDLDMVIIDNIDEFFTYKPDMFCMRKDYGLVENVNYGNNSSVMRLTAGKHGHVYNNLDINKLDHAIHNRTPNYKKHKYWADQIWITEQMQNETELWDTNWIKEYARDCHRDPHTKKTIEERKQGGIDLRTQEFFIPDGCKIMAISGNKYKNENQRKKIHKWWKE